MIEALENALNAFAGTLLIVSHDRRFVRETTERVWELRGGFTAFDGPWDYYQRKRQEAQAEATPVSASPAEEEPKPKGPSKWQLERDLESLEERIETLEARLADISDQLSQVRGARARDDRRIGRGARAARGDVAGGDGGLGRDDGKVERQKLERAGTVPALSLLQRCWLPPYLLRNHQDQPRVHPVGVAHEIVVGRQDVRPAVAVAVVEVGDA